jgi:hypothetical protein
MINNGSRNDNCVKERIKAGNRAYFANLSILKSKIISRPAEIKYIKRPVTTYGTETWTLTVAECLREKLYAEYTEK